MKTKSNLYFYTFLSKFLFPKHYLAKILAVAFLGTHVPLLALLGYFVASTSESFEEALPILLVALGATLIGAILTLISLSLLLSPVSAVSQSLRDYLSTKLRPNLPTEFKDEAGILMRDASELINQLDDSIFSLNNYDQESGLPNLLLFTERSEEIIQERSNADSKEYSNLILFVIEIENIKDLRESNSESVFNQLFYSLTDELRKMLPKIFIVGRTKDNEIALFIKNLETNFIVNDLARQISSKISKGISIENKILYPIIDIGISFYPSDGYSIKDLLSSARIATSQTNKSNERIYFASEKASAQFRYNLEIQSELRKAIDNKEINLVFQPRVSIETGKCQSFEILARWNHKTKGSISPGVFVSIAEESDLIIDLGDYIIEESLIQWNEWRKKGFTPKISINVAAKQLLDDKFIHKLDNLLNLYNVEVQFLEIELTESGLINNIEKGIEVMHSLKDRNISIALDDFGTGFSSLSYLNRFPVSTLKIDQSFIFNIETSDSARAIVASTIALAKSLGIKSTAEGIEKQADVDFLKSKGCDEGQGYLFERPESPDVIFEKYKAK
ncbi:putative bifunctional diguanylate cyclase/phosphodiesterase [Leptospira sp. GIMC2001]|uniref:putative bifunctional diguanylate cyclase/phosphodiesterase n=1 Tax=Leptospira sp. GIMC2001 TaxID=1513297 RepID=UPI00234B72B9|nr:GGDEF domain-containing phosphodiesterase [Leptospira sp. GIMC2001]WCL49559.1 EAL domain-containing protein [Leptospira sp. GIMC2001]